MSVVWQFHPHKPKYEPPAIQLNWRTIIPTVVLIYAWAASLVWLYVHVASPWVHSHILKYL